ncbi:MAG: 30S ribosomal protein S6 [Sedimentisphaerales bacterium]|nr:30S ribosomal protein S6 [Sedimentisphaerales bacterium]
MADVKRVYEGMFLADAATTDWDRLTAELQTIMDRSEAEILSLRKWDDRRLQYEIGKCRRGLYILAYFRMAPSKVASMERDVQLNDTLVRALILGADGVSEEQMTAETPAMMLERQEREGSHRRAERAAVAVAADTNNEDADIEEDEVLDEGNDESPSFME